MLLEPYLKLILGYRSSDKLKFLHYETLIDLDPKIFIEKCYDHVGIVITSLECPVIFIRPIEMTSVGHF